MEYECSGLWVADPTFSVTTLRLKQNGRHFPEDIFKYICLNDNVLISLKISLKFFPKVEIKYIPVLL